MTALTVNFEAIRVAHERKKRAVRREVRKQAGVTMRRFIREHIAKSHRGGDGLRRRTGALARSFKSVVRGEGLRDLEAVAFSEGVPYAAIHEFGGVIKPKKARWLTIPLDYVKTKAGVPRYTAREIIANPSLGNLESTFFRVTKKGNLVLFGATGKDITPLFALKKEVRIEARMGFREQWDRRRIITAIELRDAFGRGLLA